MSKQQILIKKLLDSFTNDYLEALALQELEEQDREREQQLLDSYRLAGLAE